MQKQKKEEDFWDKQKDFRLKSSFYKSNCDKFSQDKSSFAEEDLVIKNKREDYICEDLDNDDRRVQLKNKKQTFNLTWKGDVGSYHWEMRGCRLSATDKYEKQNKKELKKSAF